MERYNKLNIIGKGTFGFAWLIESNHSKKKYALKELNVGTMPTDERHLALNEVKILSNLKNRNIVRYREAFETSGKFYIVMEYADGGDLHTKIKEAKQPFAREQILDWFTQLLLAMKYIHGQNILHRDLKTQNIFLTKDDVIKLGDFGIARILDSTTDHAQTTVGTPYYLSPEICQRQTYNNKSDMWALGCVLYELATLTHPFTADSFSNLVVKILHGKYQPIPRFYGPLVEDLVAVLLQTNPEKRPSAKQLIHVPEMKPYVEKFALIQRERVSSVASTITIAKEDISETRDAKPRVDNIDSRQREAVFCVVGRSESDDNVSTRRRELTRIESNLNRQKAASVSDNLCSGAKKEDSRMRRASYHSCHGNGTRAVSVPDVASEAKPKRPDNLSRKEIKRIIAKSGRTLSETRLAIIMEHDRRRQSVACDSIGRHDTLIEKVPEKVQTTGPERNQQVEEPQTPVNCGQVVTNTENDNVKPESKLDATNNEENNLQEPLYDIGYRLAGANLNSPDITASKGLCSTSSTDVPSVEVLPLKSADMKSAKTSARREIKPSVTRDDFLQDANKAMSADGFGKKQRARAMSEPHTFVAHARRRAAREALNEHMHFKCRRLRHKSSGTTRNNGLPDITEAEKENVCTGVNKRCRIPTVAAKRQVRLRPRENAQRDIMIEPIEPFIRNKTYNVAQLKSIPILSESNDVQNLDIESAAEIEVVLEPPKRQTAKRGALCINRRQSESTAMSIKVKEKAKSLKGIHIDKTRRRAKKLSEADEVGSTRNEFSIKPDELSVVKEPSGTRESVREDQERICSCASLLCNKNSSNARNKKEVKFKFCDETLHLNATGAHSAFVQMEALRVFLEERLGTSRFVKAYQYMSNHGDVIEGMRSEVRSILGQAHMDYLPVLRQLIACEANHFGTTKV